MQDPMMFNNPMGYNFNTTNQPVEQVAMKKLPNPQNYKIVKCKNFDMGKNIYEYNIIYIKKYLLLQVIANIKTSALSLMVKQNSEPRTKIPFSMLIKQTIIIL
jgi:hypothetical protein